MHDNSFGTWWVVFILVALVIAGVAYMAILFQLQVLLSVLVLAVTAALIFFLGVTEEE